MATQVHASTRTRTNLVVDRIACDGFGMCAELLPELIDLDDWGYPIVRDGGVPDALIDHARRAVAVCPVLALRLQRIDARTETVGRPLRPTFPAASVRV
jgi:ferredoxin